MFVPVCVHNHVTACPLENWLLVSRYRVELGIADDTAESVFVCFDGVMTKLHNLKANEAGHMLVSYIIALKSRPPRVSSTQAILI